MLKQERESQFKVGDFVRHTQNPTEILMLVLVLDKTAWGIRQSDGEEAMLLVENLVAVDPTKIIKGAQEEGRGAKRKVGGLRGQYSRGLIHKTINFK
jgi:hypothetical protein